MHTIIEAMAKLNASPQQEGLARGRQIPRRSDGWELPLVELSDTHLEQHRIVSFAANDPNHIAFNLLRTRLQKLLKDNGWKSVALTSPTVGCGKTMVAVNLAFSLARQADCRTVLLDMDFRNPSLAKTIGVEPRQSMTRYFTHNSSLEECFIKVTDNLIIGLNDSPLKHSSELMHSQQIIDLLDKVDDRLAPDVVLCDLPPMRAADDAIAFLPQVDGCLLVAAAGTTTAAEVDECERQISAVANFLGVVLNKCGQPIKDYY